MQKHDLSKDLEEIEDRTKGKNQANIDEKWKVLGKPVFETILGGFWEGFGKPKSSIFALFSSFFRCKIWSAIWKGKKSKKNSFQDDEALF